MFLTSSATFFGIRMLFLERFRPVPSLSQQLLPYVEWLLMRFQHRGKYQQWRRRSLQNIAPHHAKPCAYQCRFAAYEQNELQYEPPDSASFVASHRKVNQESEFQHPMYGYRWTDANSRWQHPMQHVPIFPMVSLKSEQLKMREFQTKLCQVGVLAQ